LVSVFNDVLTEFLGVVGINIAVTVYITACIVIADLYKPLLNTNKVSDVDIAVAVNIAVEYRLGNCEEYAGYSVPAILCIVMVYT